MIYIIGIGSALGHNIRVRKSRCLIFFKLGHVLYMVPKLELLSSRKYVPECSVFCISAASYDPLHVHVGVL